MSLNKKKMVREIGRRTRIRNRDVQAVIEALIAVWTEELVSGGRIELEGFLTLVSNLMPPKDLTSNFSSLRLRVRLSKSLLHRTQGTGSQKRINS